MPNSFLDPKRNLKSLFRLAILFGLLVATCVVAYLFMGRKNKDGANILATQTGLGRAVVPWVDRADTVARKLLEGDSGQNIAKSIIGVTHPTGKNPVLGEVNVRKVGEKISVRIRTDWSGGLTGQKYATVVVWEFDKQDHQSATVTDDNAPTAIDKANLTKLMSTSKRKRTRCCDPIFGNDSAVCLITRPTPQPAA